MLATPSHVRAAPASARTRVAGNASGQRPLRWRAHRAAAMWRWQGWTMHRRQRGSTRHVRDLCHEVRSLMRTHAARALLDMCQTFGRSISCMYASLRNQMWHASAPWLQCDGRKSVKVMLWHGVQGAAYRQRHRPNEMASAMEP